MLKITFSFTQNAIKMFNVSLLLNKSLKTHSFLNADFDKNTFYLIKNKCKTSFKQMIRLETIIYGLFKYPAKRMMPLLLSLIKNAKG